MVVNSLQIRASAAAGTGDELKLFSRRSSTCHVSQVGRLGNLLKAEVMCKGFE